MQSRSNDAWSEFLEIYEQAIINFCRKRNLQEADALDVTQEVLAAVEQKIGSWDMESNSGKFRAWLFCVARNIATDKVHESLKNNAGSGDSRVNNILSELPDPSQNSICDLLAGISHTANSLGGRTYQTRSKSIIVAIVLDDGNRRSKA